MTSVKVFAAFVVFFILSVIGTVALFFIFSKNTYTVTRRFSYSCTRNEISENSHNTSVSVSLWNSVYNIIYAYSVFVLFFSRVLRKCIN